MVSLPSSILEPWTLGHSTTVLYRHLSILAFPNADKIIVSQTCLRRLITYVQWFLSKDSPETLVSHPSFCYSFASFSLPFVSSSNFSVRRFQLSIRIPLGCAIVDSIRRTKNPTSSSLLNSLLVGVYHFHSPSYLVSRVRVAWCSPQIKPNNNKSAQVDQTVAYPHTPILVLTNRYFSRHLRITKPSVFTEYCTNSRPLVSFAHRQTARQVYHDSFIVLFDYFSLWTVLFSP